MRDAGQLAAQVLDYITPHIVPGISTLKINDLCHDYILKNNAIPAPLNYRGFPKSVCTSINEVICHGIPNAEEVLKDGDIINIDVTVILNEYHGDTSRMFLVGDNVSEDARKLVDVTHSCMMAGIETIASGSRLSAIGQAIQPLAEQHGYGVVRDFCGHGIGKVFHTEPSVLHYAYDDKNYDMRFRKGMCLTVEPMINQGTWHMEMMRDGWTAKTKDRKLSAQFEHTLAVTEDGYEIFTLSPNGWYKPPYV